jgi:hypothetical protein
MSTDYGFNNIDAETDPPWGPIQHATQLDIEATLALSTIDGQHQPISGHNHPQICYDAGTAGYDVNGYVNIIPGVSASSGMITISTIDASQNIHSGSFWSDTSNNMYLQFAGDTFNIEAPEIKLQVQDPSTNPHTITIVSDGTYTNITCDEVIKLAFPNQGSGLLNGITNHKDAIIQLASPQSLNNALQTQCFKSSGLTQGPFNFFVGSSSGGSGSGNENIGIGNQALANLSTGSENIAIGAISCCNLTTSGSYNIAIGTGALSANTIGSNSVAIGVNALADYAAATGNNVAIGYQALQNFSSDNNVAIGYNAGNGYSAGDSNVMIGAGTTAAATVSKSITIGLNTTNNNSYSTVIGSSFTENTFLFGNLTIGNTQTIPTFSSGSLVAGNLALAGDTILFSQLRTISGQYSTGYPGEICVDATHLYICISSNHWTRIALTW